MMRERVSLLPERVEEKQIRANVSSIAEIVRMKNNSRLANDAVSIPPGTLKKPA